MLITDLYNNQVFSAMYEHHIYYDLALIYKDKERNIEIEPYNIRYNNITEDPVQTYYRMLVR